MVLEFASTCILYCEFAGTEATSHFPVMLQPNWANIWYNTEETGYIPVRNFHYRVPSN